MEWQSISVAQVDDKFSSILEPSGGEENSVEVSAVIADSQQKGFIVKRVLQDVGLESQSFSRVEDEESCVVNLKRRGGAELSKEEMAEDIFVAERRVESEESAGVFETEDNCSDKVSDIL